MSRSHTSSLPFGLLTFQITAIADESPLHSAPSTLSIDSSHSRSSRSVQRGPTPTSGRIQVDVKVHLDQEKTAPFQIAAALAESARQLAQSAANFEQEESLSGSFHHHHPPLHLSRSSLSSRHSAAPPPAPAGSYHHQHNALSRRRLFSNHSSSALLNYNHSSSALLNHNHSSSALLNTPLPLVSLDRPGDTVSLDKPRMATTTQSLSRTRGQSQWTRRNSTSSSKSFNSDSVVPLGLTPAQRQHLLQQQGRRLEDESIPLHHATFLTSTLPPAQEIKEMSCILADKTAEKPNLAATADKPAEKSNANLLTTADKPVEKSDLAVASQANPPNNRTLESSPHLNKQNGEEPSASMAQQADGETPSSHSSSQPSLSRSGSGLSLEPQLSSTASGYAATGSTSSLDTLSKTTPPAESASSHTATVLEREEQGTRANEVMVSLASPQTVSAHPVPPHRAAYPLISHPAPPALAYTLPPLTAYPHTRDHMIYPHDHMTNTILHSTAAAAGELATFKQRGHTHSYQQQHSGISPLSSHPSDSITIDV